MKSEKWLKLFGELTAILFMAMVGIFVYQFSGVIACIIFVATFIVVLQFIVEAIFSIKFKIWGKK